MANLHVSGFAGMTRNTWSPEGGHLQVMAAEVSYAGFVSHHRVVTYHVSHVLDSPLGNLAVLAAVARKPIPARYVDGLQILHGHAGGSSLERLHEKDRLTFVDQQALRLLGSRAGDGDAPHFTAGQLARVAVCQIGNTKLGEQRASSGGEQVRTARSRV